MPNSGPPVIDAERAASRVLEAERAARTQVEQCEQQCARLIAETQARGTALHARTGVRIERLRERMKTAAHTRLDRIRAEEAALAADTAIGIPAPLDAALDQLVAEMTGDGG